MSVLDRNNVNLSGDGEPPLVFAHGFGSNQSMWRYVAPNFADSNKVVLFDHVGAGGSDLAAISKTKYATLQGYADDVIEIVEQFGLRNSIFVGHSYAP